MYNYEEDRMERERRHFDWVPMNDERMTMLRSLRDTCKDCVMCELGRGMKAVRGTRIDPHVFSNMKPSKFMVIGQNPGFNECRQDEPFVGDAGANFNKEIEKHGLNRNDFYITNTLKCLTPDNRSPNLEEIIRCHPFLLMELTILNPRFIITLGAVSFKYFCPKAIYSKALGNFTHSEKINKKVFAIYHPSPRNLAMESRKTQYERQIELLCKLIKFSKQKEQVRS
jgi:DNA polymerase